MSKDIFLAAQAVEGKSSPIVAALLYSYCPAAAHWYLTNKPVEDVFDVVWQALEDYAEGGTMIERLTDYGLASLIPDVKKYIEDVDAYRSHHTNETPAPELTPFFRGGQRSLERSFGLQAALNKLGGSWKSVLEYVRVWAFLMRDWKNGMLLPEEGGARRVFQKFILSLSAPGVSSNMRTRFPVWGWEATLGKVKWVYLGLLVKDGCQDALRFSLTSAADLAGDQSWESSGHPALYALGRDGTATPVDLPMERRYVMDMVAPMYRAACIGPNFPLGATRNDGSCRACGYRAVCFGQTDNRALSESLRQLLAENPRKGYRPGKPIEVLSQGIQLEMSAGGPEGVRDG